MAKQSLNPLAVELLKKSGLDLDTAQQLLKENDEDKYYQIAFFVQQTVEKSLKAIIAAHGGEIKKLHSFAPLFASLELLKIEIPAFAYDAAESAVYDMGERYDLPCVTSEKDLIEACEKAKKVLVWAKMNFK